MKWVAYDATPLMTCMNLMHGLQVGTDAHARIPVHLQSQSNLVCIRTLALVICSEIRIGTDVVGMRS